MIKKSLLILISLFILLSCAEHVAAPELYSIDVSLPYEELKQEIKEKLKFYFGVKGSYRIILSGTPREYSRHNDDTVGLALLNALAEMDIKNITIDVDLRYINYINGTLPENMFYAYDPEKNNYFSPFYNFIFPENRITTIGNYAFENNWCIKEIVIPDSVITMGFAAFFGCDRLEKITLGKGIKRIDGILVFGYCDVLKEVDTSRCSSLEYIDKLVFYELPAVTEFAIPASVKEINRFPFNHCNNLTTIIYYGDSPNNVTFLDKRSIFSYCPEVKNLIVPNAINPDDDGWKTFGNANFTYVGREKPKQ
ncbi:leucine-rich repeat domain-containing protein [Brachyspira intermedia]|uniref:leucine-rich repeat domain-containing protein n=1 Tax=Brachyspira intermedia TaxID=84377 RepID=UPI003007D49E